ncbi:MAG TPA: polyphosphate kinase 1 [Bacteroidales bacterium]|nr:polyphosphate kinase 1 [Bacteroidales bacterium]HPS72808.1 polyphosphate kinase 1 [Bacteroidales bacterium]
MKKKQDIELLNREISWLHFNGRVLQEAADTRNPLLERLKFLGIFSNNRDEFFRVRVATLNRMMKVDSGYHDIPNDPRKILREILSIVQTQEKNFIRIYDEIVSELAKHGIHIIDETHLSKDQGTFVRKYFQEKVRVLLFPMMISSIKDISSLVDKSIYLAITLGRSAQPGKTDYALIELPTRQVSRFLILPEEGNHKYVILLDDVIRFCLDEIFSVFGYDRFAAYTVKVTRDAELDIDTDVSKSFLESMTESLKQRKKGIAVRFVYDQSIPSELLKIILKRVDVTKKDPIRGGGRYHNFKDFMSFPNFGHPELEYKPMPPLPHKDLPRNQSILAVMSRKDIMLHYPYQSFQYIIDLLREASIDTRIKSIKMTIYRAAKNSNVINALINAARNGKFVTVYMELQARFDEEANISWTERLREEGVKVIHSIPGFKVHSKLLLIRGKENKKDLLYSMISTGNFNEDTAKVYADDCLLTCHPQICADVYNAFHQMETAYKPYKYKALVLAPFSMRNFFIRLIQQEIRNVREGKEAWIIIKLNNLVDEIIIRKLYKASQEGVKVKLLVRGICVLVPGVPGLSENIEGTGIVDRFLEHSRVLVFCNGGDPQYYITSADWMVRNFDNRIEVACPVFDPEIRKEIRAMLELQMADNVKARIIGYKEHNVYKTSPGDPVKSQTETYRYFQKACSGN